VPGRKAAQYSVQCRKEGGKANSGRDSERNLQGQWKCGSAGAQVNSDSSSGRTANDLIHF
jgi:hypothetical protein